MMGKGGRASLIPSFSLFHLKGNIVHAAGIHPEWDASPDKDKECIWNINTYYLLKCRPNLIHKGYKIMMPQDEICGAPAPSESSGHSGQGRYLSSYIEH